MLEIFTILIGILLSALAGLAIGKIVVDESIFEGWVSRIRSKCFYPVDETDSNVHQDPNTGGVVRVTDEGEWIVLSEDGYRTDLPKPLALLLGKTGDLFECSRCFSKQVAMWLAIFSVALTLLPLKFVAVPATLGVVYLLERLING